MLLYSELVALYAQAWLVGSHTAVDGGDLHLRAMYKH